MKVLVTGAAGYIGSHTVKELIDAGHTVFGIDNFDNSDSSNLDALKAAGYKFEFMQADLCYTEDILDITEHVRHYDAVIHFAGRKKVNQSVNYPLAYYRNNLVSTINLLDLMNFCSIKNIVFSSSCTVYGQADYMPITEGTPLKKAESPYGSTKQMCEQIIQDWVNKKSEVEKNAVILRYFNPAGAHPDGLIGETTEDLSGLVPALVKYAKGGNPDFRIHGGDYETRDGSCVRDYVHVVDLAKAHVKAIEYAKRESPTYDVFNLGSGEGTTVLEFIEAFKKNCLDIEVEVGPRRAGDVVSAYADITKAKEVLQWEPLLGIDDIVKTAWSWENK